MSWFDIIKGKFISSKVLRKIKKGIEGVDGVTINEIIWPGTNFFDLKKLEACSIRLLASK